MSTPISETERACLERVAAHPGTVNPDCKSTTLESLLAHGLISRTPVLGLPVLPNCYRYEITAAGSALLHS